MNTFLYKTPKYYEIAFSFRDVQSEVDFFEKAIKKFSKIKVGRVFELASGNSPYLEEWHKRGYEYFGLDLNSEMLDFVAERAQEKGIKAKLFRANMNKFSLKKLRVDLAYVLLGSLYVKSNEEFFQHLDSVSSILKSGGLYILDGVVWFNIFSDNKQSWTIFKRGIKVKSTFRNKLVDPVAQVFREELILEIWEQGKKKEIQSGEIRKIFFPQEFLTLVKCHNKFEFLGWFNNFNLNKPATPKGRQCVILRKR